MYHRTCNKQTVHNQASGLLISKILSHEEKSQAFDELMLQNILYCNQYRNYQKTSCTENMTNYHQTSLIKNTPETITWLPLLKNTAEIISRLLILKMQQQQQKMIRLLLLNITLVKLEDFFN